MPSLHDKTQDGVLCTFNTRTSATAAGLARSSQQSSTMQTRASYTVRQGRRHRSSITTQISSGCVALLQPVRRASVLGHLSSLRLHWSQPMRPAWGLVQHDGPPGWLKKIDPVVVIFYMMDRPYRLPFPNRLPWEMLPSWELMEFPAAAILNVIWRSSCPCWLCRG